jgi:hypothetical protein
MGSLVTCQKPRMLLDMGAKVTKQHGKLDPVYCYGPTS